MEHSTRTPQRPRPRPAMAPASVPRPAGRAPAPPQVAAGTRRPPFTAVLARLPRPKLTGLGCGVLAALAMAGAGWLSRLFGGSPALYGVLFLLVSAAAAAWVRPADLICGPIAVPIAFALGIAATGELYGVVTYLALHAPWLFAGTGAALVVFLVRGARLAIRRRRRRRR